MNVYEKCPQLESRRFLLRLVRAEDCKDLLKVYSDQKAVPLFNSDNCHGDSFYYQTEERMTQAIDFWLFSYQHQYFVRWSIVEKKREQAIGTVELFTREGLDQSGYTALLRLDLRSDFEKPDELKELLSLLSQPACELFGCESVTTKAAPVAAIRRKVLCELGYRESSVPLTGDDGTPYDGYWVYTKNA